MPSLWAKGPDIVKVPIFPTWIDIFYPIPNKIPADFFVELTN